MSAFSHVWLSGQFSGGRGGRGLCTIPGRHVVLIIPAEAGSAVKAPTGPLKASKVSGEEEPPSRLPVCLCLQSGSVVDVGLLSVWSFIAHIITARRMFLRGYL